MNFKTLLVMKKIFLPLLSVVFMSVLLVGCKGNNADLIAENIEFETFSTSRMPEDDANLSVSIYLELPKRNVNAKLDSIYDILVDYYTKGTDREIQSGIEIYADSIESAYFEMKRDMAELGSLLAIEYYDSIYPVYAHGDILGYSQRSYEFEGGAHGIYVSHYSTFSLSMGRVLSENDIFNLTDENMNDIAGKLVEDFKQESGESPWCDTLDFLNGNFYVTDDAMYYQYEPYELGSYAVGAPCLELSKEFLKPYMKQDGPLFNCWFGK